MVEERVVLFTRLILHRLLGVWCYKEAQGPIPIWVTGLRKCGLNFQPSSLPLSSGACLATEQEQLSM